MALVEWAVPAVLAAVLWWPFLPAKAAGPKVPVVAARGLWRDPLAWQVTAFMAQVSTSFYSVLAWFPLIMRDRGETPASAGLLMAVMMMMQLVFSLACPLMASWGRDQRLLTVVMCLATVAGTAGCIFMPMSGIWLWALVLGAGQGGIFGIALSFLVLRAPDGRVAAQLSGMAQGVGYLIACAGPMAIGLLRQHTGDWRAGGVLLVVVGLGMLLAGLGAGRDRHVLAGRAD